MHLTPVFILTFLVHRFQIKLSGSTAIFAR